MWISRAVIPLPLRRALSLALVWAGCSLSLTGWAVPLPEGVARALRAANIPLDAVSIVVQDVTAHAPLLEWNENVVRNPASLMKLVTTYSALTDLGPAKTWRTEIRGGMPVDGVVTGNLYVVGSGDPHLTLEDWGALLRSLRIRGVKEIRGNLVLDGSLFQAGLQDPGEFDHQGYRAYNTPPAALQVGFKAITVTLAAVGDRMLALPNFELPGVQIRNLLTLRPGTCPGDWKSSLTQEVEDNGQAASITLKGDFMEGCGKKTLSYSVLSNEAYISAAFAKIWSELGGSLSGGAISGVTPANLPVLASHESLPLADQIREINKRSNNVMARTLFLDLGQGDAATPSTLAASSARARQILLAQGLDFPEMILENGAGLSRRERISAAHLGALLVQAARGLYRAEFMASLSLAGMDGTAEKQAADEALWGRFHLKTGTLDGVKGFAGYGLSRRGRLISVVFLVNHPLASGAGPAQDALMHWILREL